MVVYPADVVSAAAVSPCIEDRDVIDGILSHLRNKE